MGAGLSTNNNNVAGGTPLAVQLTAQISVEEVVAAAEAAGAATLHVCDTEAGTWGLGLKGLQCPLTKAYRVASKLLTERLVSLSPHVPIISQETMQEDYEIRQKYEYCWLVDALDGAAAFLDRSGSFSVNVALLFKGAPVLGVVHAPLSGTTYWAVKDKGAWGRRTGATSGQRRLKAGQFAFEDKGLMVALGASLPPSAFTPGFIPGFTPGSTPVTAGQGVAGHDTGGSVGEGHEGNSAVAAKAADEGLAAAGGPARMNSAGQGGAGPDTSATAQAQGAGPVGTNRRSYCFPIGLTIGGGTAARAPTVEAKGRKAAADDAAKAGAGANHGKETGFGLVARAGSGAEAAVAGAGSKAATAGLAAAGSANGSASALIGAGSDASVLLSGGEAAPLPVARAVAESKMLQLLNSPNLLQIPSSCLRLVAVATGDAHLCPCLGPCYEWDVAAADIIIREAGGAVLSAGEGEEDWKVALPKEQPLAYNSRQLLVPRFVAFAQRRPDKK